MQELIVDLHIHSHYSRATSKSCNFEGLYKWGKLKGITIIGTGDFTHPEWFAEMRSKLEPAEQGLFKLKDELAEPIDKLLSPELQGLSVLCRLLKSLLSTAKGAKSASYTN
jgi:DNA helicase II / ATP-dependent DNA helicase PcrA